VERVPPIWQRKVIGPKGPGQVPFRDMTLRLNRLRVR
jgi:hypothetical protein